MGHRHIGGGILGGMDRHDWDRRYSATDLVWTAEPNRWLVAEAAGLPPGRALDLGCGEGGTRWTRWSGSAAARHTHRGDN